MTDTMTYAEQWADAINDTYNDEAREWAVSAPLEPNDDVHELVTRALSKAAVCLRYGDEMTFSGPELEAIRHFMPAHEVDLNGSVRWVRANFGFDPEIDEIGDMHRAIWAGK